MKKNVLSLLCAVFLTLSACPFSATAQEEASAVSPAEGYLIGPGDLLVITVWKNAELSQQLPVRPDGRISLPLLGETEAAGMTVPQLTEDLKSRYAKYMTEPVLSVSVQQVNSMLVYVIGQVRSPGMFSLNSNIDVLQALAKAAGLTPFAEGDNIKIFRKHDGNTEIFPFNYDAVARGRKLEQNIVLKRGDVIVVP
ncbi:MAG: polysaccharide biosynthesis/export family protein [Proteobacteria bacterium]|nr:polysaccharide biosynthesis/export family protein [Pseudomonadota bacterium]MBU1547883.1 polysaccharide biosynthesis/export family protein [Pseudomonadota bacterium]